MDKNDLLKMLDLNGSEALHTDAASLAITSAENAFSPSSHHPTVLDLDEWGMRRGRELLASSERMRTTKLDEHAVADFYGASFEPEPLLRDSSADQQRHEFMKQLVQTPDYRSLHESTKLNSVASEIAAVAFAEQFAALKKEASKSKPGSDPEMSTLRAVGKALAKAEEEVEGLKEAAAAMGLGPGMPGANDAAAIARIYRQVRGNASLRRICELAGRYRRLAQSKQRQKTAHGLDDVVGVTLDGDVGRLLPVELAKLTVPELELDVLRRLVERQVMCREHKGVVTVGKGPILVVVDESGSMQGEKVETAKALALAMAWIARRQRRWCGLIAYSGDSGERLLALPAGRWDEGLLAEWLLGFLGAGSSLDVPLQEMPDYYQRIGAPAGQTDVLFITDAVCRVPRDIAERFKSWKTQVRARVLSLVIDSAPGDLEGVSDEIYETRSLGVHENAVGRALGV